MRKLDELMEKQGKTVNDLADALGESYMVAWNKLNGRTKLKNTDKIVIAMWLGVSEKELED